MFDVSYEHPRSSSGREAVNVWCAMSHQGLGLLVIIKEGMTAEVYSEFMGHVHLPYVIEGPFPDGCFVFQHDFRGILPSRIVRKLCDDRGIHVMS